MLVQPVSVGGDRVATDPATDPSAEAAEVMEVVEESAREEGEGQQKEQAVVEPCQTVSRS